MTSTTPVRPEPVEGLSFSSAEDSEGRASTSSARTALGETEAERGTAQVSEKVLEGGGEIDVTAAG
jgi:hypothetical protein